MGEREVVAGQRSPSDPDARPGLQFAALVTELDRAGVRWVMTGSAVLAAYGADLVPNDLDVTPDLGSGNLRRLAGVLDRLRAVPARVPTWDDGLSDEERRRWRPEPPTEQHLDHLYVTALGMLDVVPRLCGTYDELIDRSSVLQLGDVEVRLCDPADVLRRLEGRTRTKDLSRRAVYETVARRLADGSAAPVIARLL